MKTRTLQLSGTEDVWIFGEGSSLLDNGDIAFYSGIDCARFPVEFIDEIAHFLNEYIRDREADE